MLFNVSNLALGLKSSLFNSSKFFNNASSKTFSAFSFSPLLFLLFYEIYDSVNKVIDVFQCPTSGFLLFYTLLQFWKRQSWICFNALPRAFFFSISKTSNGNSKISGVSMPYLGLSSFLWLKKISRKQKTLMFQCPTSGFLLFYVAINEMADKKLIRFNALPRAFFFSIRKWRKPWIATT